MVPNQKETGKKTATITINDEAKKANTDYAVNGLHIYSEGHNDNNNYRSGAQVPIGTKITIYEYNTASEAHLTVVHNGKTIADKSYSILKSDSDVDFIEFIVEGDVTVTTAVGRKKSQSLPSTPTLVPTPPLPPIVIAPPTLEQKYKIIVDNQVSEAIVNLSYLETVNQIPKSIKIAPNQAIKTGTGIYVQLLNPTDHALKVTAYVDNQVVGTVLVDPKTNDEEYAAGGLMGNSYQGIPLTGEMRIDVEKISRKTEYTVQLSGSGKDKIKVQHGNKTLINGEPILAGKHSFIIQNKEHKAAEYQVTFKVNGLVVAQKNVTEKAPLSVENINVDGDVEVIVEEVENMATITIHDYAKLKNSNFAVNGLHVYSQGYNNDKNFNTGQKMPIGTNISVYEYNTASPVHITIEMNGQKIADNVQDYIRSDNDVQFYEFALTGDVTITTRAVEEKTSPKLHIENGHLGFVYNTDTYQELADQHSLQEGKQNLSIYSNQTPVDVTVTMGGNTLISQRLEANKNMELTNLSITSDVVISFKEVPKPLHHQLTITGDAKDMVSVTEGNKVYTDKSDISDGKHSFSIYNAAYEETEYDITIKVNGQIISRGTAFEYVSFDATVDVAGDIEIIAHKRKKKHFITVIGDSKDKIRLYMDSKELSSRAEVEEGSVNLYVYPIDFDDAATYTVILKKNGVVLSSQTANGYLSADFEKIALDADIEIEVKQ